MTGRERLEDLPILRFLPADTRALVVESFEPASFAFGDLIVREGDSADAFYVLVSGKARVVKLGEQGEEIALTSLRPGQSFGEMGLLDHSTRTATVRASSDVEALRLDKSVFEALVRRSPDIRQYFELQIKHRKLENFFHHYIPYARLPPAALATLLSELAPLEVTKGTVVVRQGDSAGPLYIVEDGHLRVFTEEDGRRRYVAYLRKGDFFGEMSVFQGVSRTASVEAVSPCRLLVLRPDTFRKLLAEVPGLGAQIEERIAQYDYRQTARVPLDFAEEILPAEAAVQEMVGPDQVEQGEEETEAGGEVEGAPFAEDGRFVKSAGRIRRFPVVRQIDEMDCGAASLAMVCRHYGRAVSLARIRQLVHTSLDGTSLKGLCHAATELGLAARSVKASPENLAQMPLPAIVHWEGNHWVVLHDVTPTHCRVADPAFGLRRFTRSEFEERWSGYAALFDYTDAFETAPVTPSNLAWLVPFFRPFQRILLQALGLGLIGAALQMILPIFTQVIVDRVLVERRRVALEHDRRLDDRGPGLPGPIDGRPALSVELRRRADRRVIARLPDPQAPGPSDVYFSTRRTGDIQRRLEGMRNVREFLVQSGVAGLAAATQLGASLILMLIYSRALTVVFLLTAPLYGLLMVLSARWLRPVFDTLEDSFGKYHSHQIDAIKGIETVKALGAEGSFREIMLESVPERGDGACSGPTSR